MADDDRGSNMPCLLAANAYEFPRDHRHWRALPVGFAPVSAWVLLLDSDSVANLFSSKPAARQAVRTSTTIANYFAHALPAENLKFIDGSQHSLDIAAFAFTHPDISAAVIRAQKRGVIVRMVVDATEEHGNASLVPDLTKAGIDVWVRHKSGFQHNKYMLIDQSVVTTGSYNFTVSADKRNAENLLVIRNAPQVVKAFTDDYKILRRGSPYKDK